MSEHDGLIVMNRESGEIIATLADWLQQHRRRQLKLIIKHLGQGEEAVAFPEVDSSQLAESFFAPPEELV